MAAGVSLATIKWGPTVPCKRAPHSGCWGDMLMGTLSFGGRSLVCNGSPGGTYLHDITLDPKACLLGTKASLEFGVDMPHCVGPINSTKGYFIHEYPLMCSAGCVHLAPGDAKTFYDWVGAQHRVRLVTS